MEQQEKQLLENIIKQMLELRKLLDKEEKDEDSEEKSEVSEEKSESGSILSKGRY